jgi:hypothetical protein
MRQSLMVYIFTELVLMAEAIAELDKCGMRHE